MAASGLTEIELPRSGPDILAVGAFLKNSVCAIKGRTAFLSPGIGNLDSAPAIADFETAIGDAVRTLHLKPRFVAHDLHPDFYSTRWAQAQGTPAFPVQHHHAHIAAVAAEHGHAGPVIGLALDGFGLGPNNQSWGGELLLVEGCRFDRLGHLALLAQPGGDIAAREPWRMAAAVLHRLGRGADIATIFSAQPMAARLGGIIAKGINCPPTSSAGRLFDAACGLLNVHPVARFEGEAPMALEALVKKPAVMTGGWTVENGVLDLLPLMAALIGRPAEEGADLFHGTLIAALADWAERACRQSGTATVALGGGCFFNAVLRHGLVDQLEARRLRPLLPIRVSPGDPGVSLGQAWVAADAASRL